jgi:hypothetical protein
MDRELERPSDNTYIGLTQDWEVRYWCTRFGVNVEELRACVDEVGPRADDVERRLKAAGRKAFDKMGEN